MRISDEEFLANWKREYQRDRDIVTKALVDNPGRVKLHYWRLQRPYTKNFDTLHDCLEWMMQKSREEYCASQMVDLLDAGYSIRATTACINYLDNRDQFAIPPDQD